MKILLFIAIGFIAGYVVKDLTTTESEVIYRIKRLRAKRGGVVTVNADKDDKVIIEEKRKQKRRLRKNK